MSQKLINSYQQFLDGNGNPLAGGSLVFSETGTDTPKTVYSAENQSGSLGSTVDLDSAGRPTSGGGAVEIYSAASGAYRITVKDSSGTNVVVTENVSALLEFSALTMTGQFLADDSTVTATPPISFDGDGDTGIARPAANTLAGVVGGIEKIRINSTGLGVGKTPSSALDVAGRLLASLGVATGSYAYTSGTETVLTLSDDTQMYLLWSAPGNYGGTDDRHGSVAVAGRYDDGRCFVTEVTDPASTATWAISGNDVTYSGGGGVPSTAIRYLRLN